MTTPAPTATNGLPADSQPAGGETNAWDTAVLVVSAATRAELLQRISALLAQLERYPQTPLGSLAAALNAHVGGHFRLALVAANVDELCARLLRAQQRLSDDRVRQIRDTVGIYYFDEPFYPGGTIAFLFPGEGAQYLNMLGNLHRHFPHVDAMLARCDELSASMPEPMPPLSRFFRFPEGASREERAAAEQELRGLGNAMYSVVLADRVLFDILQQLGVQPDCMAGHSMGEMAALSAAGCFQDDSLQVAKIAQTVRRLEEAEDGPGAVLLAVGLSKAKVDDLVRKTLGCTAGGAESSVYVAMDNCPHQSVVVGLSEPVAAVEAALQAQRIVFERLALKRPYHTPLFAPAVSSLEAMFADTEFQVPQVPVYSCTTARPFPADPAEIRRLSIWHWAMPVEFTRMIENMYDDGVRLFVETGPRGNLSAFVEDILRGKPQLTVPANVPRRSATVQLNHLVAQLAAQHVPIRFELLRSQEAHPIDWLPQFTSTSSETTPVAEPISPSTAIPAPAPPSELPAVASPDPRLAIAGDSGRVVAQYLDVMEQFLATQQTVMQRYLAARRSPQAGTVQTVRRRRRAASPQSSETVIPPSLAARMSPPPLSTHPRFVELPPARSQPRQPAFGPLVGNVVEYVAGQRIVMRRRLEIEEDLYAQEHTVGGRNVSKLDANQHGLPVAPMTFSLETMAELAQALFPQLAVHGIRNVELMRWLAFDEIDPSQVEAVAQAVPLSSPDALLPAATVAVEVEIVDLGNQANQPPPRMRWVAAKGTVLLGPAIAEPPPAGEFPLTGERPCRISLEALYQNLFHGEKFQGVECMPRYGEEGIEANIRVLPRNGLLRSNPAPRFVFDPVLTDIAMHPLAAWHLEQPDQSGRILLPFGLESLQLFGPLPAEGTPLISRVRTLQTTTRQFVHAVDVVDHQGRLRMRLTGAKYWRFYVPFGEINFHGPKDEYFISDRYPELAAQLSSTPAPACVRLDPPLDVLQPAMRAAIVKVAFSPAEQAAFRQLAVRDAEKSVWLFSRMAAKDAVRIAWSNHCGERLFPADMESQLDQRGRPRIVHRDRQRTDALPSVSVAHYQGRYVAAAADSALLGVDLLKIDADAPTLLAQLAPRHQALINAQDDPTAAGLRILAACRAAARALSGSIDNLAATWQVEQFDPDSGRVVLAATTELIAAFPELEGRGFLAVATHRDEAWIAAITVDQQVRA